MWVTEQFKVGKGQETPIYYSNIDGTTRKDWGGRNDWGGDDFLFIGHETYGSPK